MISRYTVDVTSQRMQETEQAIVEQRRYVDSLNDPALKAIATRTLTTLEDILLLMQRTHALLVVTASDAAENGDLGGHASRQRSDEATPSCPRP